MYVLIHFISRNDLFRKQLPVFLTAFLIAEFFYKWHSFALECMGFLATWYVLDAARERFWAPTRLRAATRPEDG